jgi:hypothetical protein
MKTPKKQHPAEIAAEAQMIVAIRGADHFLASLFRGAGQYDKAPAPTVLAALRAGRAMEAGARGTQKSIIYAVGPDGRATMITYALIEKLAALATQQKGTK